jgi:hypothetical protein
MGHIMPRTRTDAGSGPRVASAVRSGALLLHRLKRSSLTGIASLNRIEP